MENKKLKKLTALLLSIAMVFSLTVEAFPAAFAAGEGVSTPVQKESGTAAGGTAVTESANSNFEDSSATGRPSLYVDFLGDNQNYDPSAVAGGSFSVIGSGALASLAVPAGADQSKKTNPSLTTNRWEGYKNGEIDGSGNSIYGNTIFWVGVGIDRMHLLELLKDGDGIYGLELGFYYDNRYLEPYTGATANDDAGYKTVLEAANINHSTFQNQWSANYTILEAHTNMQPQTDPVTQEVLQKPSMGTVLSDSNWRMTYVSLEYQTTNVNDERFHGENANTDEDTQYLLMIPFRLKAYATGYNPDDPQVYLRLARSAGLFSISGGEGNSPYAAWERVTTRNPGRELKLMANFRGDLDIFGGGKYLEPDYRANLIIENAGGSDNTAVLSVKDDPSPTPVSVNTHLSYISGLRGGIGMQLDVHVATGYKVEVTVDYTDSSGNKVTLVYTTTKKDSNNFVYTFIMPEHDVTVTVRFTIDDASDFWLFLKEEEQDKDGNPLTAPSGYLGNSTVVTTTYHKTVGGVSTPVTTILDKDSLPHSHSRYGDLPAEQIPESSGVTATISVHGDYEAVVWFERESIRASIAATSLPADAVLAGTDPYTYLLPTGGDITLAGGMPKSDVVLHVTYRPATKYKAILEVLHTDVTTIPTTNVAQLTTTVYDKQNEPQKAYSGVVFEEDTDSNTPDRYRHTEADFRVLDRVDTSSASGSGSLGGDGRTPKTWSASADSLTALLVTATSTADLNGIQPLDLRWNGVSQPVGKQPEDGLRKNAVGEFYTDSDIGDFYDRLMELKMLIENDLTASGSAASVQKVTTTAADGTSFTYYDLTVEQVQMYLLDYEAHRDYLAADAQYTLDKAQYDADLANYNRYLANKKAAEDAGLTYEGAVVREPKLPAAPVLVTAPALRTQADASAAVAAHQWYTPSAPSDPVTATTDCYLEVRGGRQMAVVLEAGTDYQVKTIELIDPTGAHPTVALNDGSGALTKNPDYQNEYLFTMPDYECIVRVTYTKRDNKELTLHIVGDYYKLPTDTGVNTEPENYVELTGYGPNATGVTAVPFGPRKDHLDKEQVLVDSTVSLRVYKSADYNVSVEVLRSTATGEVPVTVVGTTTNMANGTLVTFKMPADATRVVVTYTKNTTPLNAHLIFDHIGTQNVLNAGTWDSNHSTTQTAYEGDVLTATINVEPGYYIYAAEAYTEDGSYPFSLSGNGWNNGAGGTVSLTTTMPDKEYWVKIVFKKGPPDAEPTQILRLTVNDPENAGTDDNWAKIEVTRATTNVATLTAGKGATGGGSTSVSAYTQAGDGAVLTFGAATGYFVTAIAVLPDGTGVSLTRVSTAEATFVVPAASVNVVVTFSKTENDKKLYLTLAKTEDGVRVDENWKSGGNMRNPLLTVDSPSIAGVVSGGLTVPESNAGDLNVLPATFPSGTSGTTTTVAKPGETVTVTFMVSSGWYVNSLTVSGDDGRIGYTLKKSDGTIYDKNTDYKTDGTTITLTAEFVMPASDVYMAVNYRSFIGTPDIDKGEHQLELVVQDPDNTATPAANNTASATVSGVDATARTIPALGKATANGMRGIANAWAGEEVVIDYSADTGFTMEIILVTPAGLRVPVTYFVDTADGNKVKARFTMPDSDCTAIVRFKEGTPEQYTANLVLHFPAGTATSKYDTIGEGSFRTVTYGLDSGKTKCYALNATAGERLDLDLLAHDGYYISKVTAEAAALGVTVNYTGAFGRQTGDVVMPAADLQINVYFAKGWPDEAEYNVTLKVLDSTGINNSANFVSVNNATDLPTTPTATPVDTTPVTDRGSVTISPVKDEDLVRVAINPQGGCYASSITVKDSSGNSVPWRYVTGGIAFEMVPSNVTVKVLFAKRKKTEATPTVTLHTNATVSTVNLGTVTVTHPDGATKLTADGTKFGIDVPAYGQTVTVEATPDSPSCITSAYAVTASGAILPLEWVADGTIHTDMPQVTAGGTVTFAMPGENVDVYVYFSAVSPVAGEQVGMLTVVGPNGSGSGEMYVTADRSKTTGTVNASGANSLFAPHGTELTVDLTVNPGYSIKAMRVTDGDGNALGYVWTIPGEQFTLTMQPTNGVRVYVELEAADSTRNLTAQIIVNNDGEPINTAVLRDLTTSGSILSPVHVGDTIHIDAQLKSGYRVEYIKIVPAKFGLSAALTADSAYTGVHIGQTGSFVMPNEDVVVYVKFTKDTRTRYNVVLTAIGDADSMGGNNAYMTNGYTRDTSLRVYPSGYSSYTPNTDSIQAAPATADHSAEWVTVDYAWANGKCVKSVTVKDSAGNPIPFTQLLNDTANRLGQITFPMVNSDPVNVVVEWADEADRPKYDAILHVIDLDHPSRSDNSWGELTWNGTVPSTTTGQITSKTPSTTGFGLGVEKIEVPAGETVTVDVLAQDQGTATPTYIKAAYVLCRADGQMIKLNLTPDDPSDPTSAFTGAKTADFVMHPGQNDVYVYFTKDPQKLTDYAAVLMLDSPASDRNSTASISRPARAGESADVSDSVRANVDDHGYITANKGELITVTVNPAEGYTIDSVLMTPLGIEESQGGTVKLNGAVANADGSFTYTFTMPAENVAVRVKLKEGIVPKKYKAYLNYGLVELNADGTVKSTTVLTGDHTTGDWAKASFTDGASTIEWYDNMPREVPNGKTVTVGAQVIPAHYILAAYVLTDEGVLVPLSTALEGLQDLYPTDSSKIDYDSTFTMPAEDVHIYVWFSDKAPLTSWHTAVLTAVDEDTANAIYNSGKNSATIESSTNNPTAVEVWSFGEPAHKFIWVEQGETVTVKTGTIDPDYQYVVTSLSANSGTPPTLTGPSTIGTTNDCTYTVPNENTAAVVKFETAMQKKSRLNVVLIDPDNPGTVRNPIVNAADVTVSGGTIAGLHVESVTPAGARQVIPDVLSGKTIDFTITPAAGYSVIALYKDSKGAVQGTWALDTLSGNFTMLNEETTLEIYYFKAHTVTLEVKDTRGTTPVSTAQMTENRLGLTAETADNTPKTGTYTLPTGTTVTAEMVAYGADSKLLGVLVTNEYGTFPQTLKAEPAQYTYTISNDTNICFVLGDSTKTNEYIASVSAVNRPAGTALPTIVASPVHSAHGAQWTAAENGDTITVTLDVPAGYEASFTTSDGTTITPNGVSGASAAVAGATATFSMPANNVHVTVTYKKVRFTATIQTAGTGSGSASLNDGATTVTALGTITGLSGSETMTYTATPSAGSSVSYILLQTAGGSSSLLNNAGGTFTMPADDVTVTAVFDTDGNKHHIAYVTTVDTDGMPNNAAQNIENLSNSALDTAYGMLYTYGDRRDNIFVAFTTEPGYVALVTAKIAGTTTVVPVTQSGTSGNCTASLVMPDADVEIIITYGPSAVLPVGVTPLTLRLVGHEQDADNTATLTYQTAGGTGALTLTASGAGSNAPYYSGKANASVVGGTLDLDAWRDADFIFERMTVANWNGDPTNPVLYTEVDLSWNEYLTNGISLFTMPNSETLVTVYYGHPYHATLFVIDKDGTDYNGGITAGGSYDPADTAATPHDKVPTVKLESTVGTTTPTNNPTTKTHDPIDNLDGRETITTTVNGDNTMPADSEIASVIASTKSGTVHLTANGGGTSQSGVYEYKMSNLSGSPVRYADNVDITVVLRDITAPDKLHTATVYKVGHDDKAGNSAAISNDTNSTLVNGTIWTAGYQNDALTVTVTTEVGYYALVTAVDSDRNTVPVIQWAVTGTSSAPISVAFTMPDADLDITVTYYKDDPPKEPLKLTIKDHGDKADNVGAVYGNVSGTATTASPKLLTATGADALTAAGTGATSGVNPYTVTNSAVTVGTYLLTDTATNSDYYVKSVTLVVTTGTTTTTYDLLDTTLMATFTPRVPVGGAEIVVEFAQGKVTGRPYDPEHSEAYNSSAAHAAGNYQQGVNTGDNPDLSKAPLRGTADAEGWILAESVDVDAFTFVVTVPTLFDKTEVDTTTGMLKLSDALKDAGIDPTSAVSATNVPPVYKFYWWDDANSKYVEFTAAELSITAQDSLSYANNPKGDYPKGTTDQHYGYQLELTATIPTSGTLTPAEQILKDCFEKGGAIYVTATNQAELYINGTKAPWIEGEKTQVVVQPDNVLKPYDPENVNPSGTTGTYEDHWIRAENRGDYLIVTVPMLNNKAGDSPTNVDDSIHRLRLYLQDDTAGNRLGTITDVTDLLNLQNIRGYENKWNRNLEYDSTWTAGSDLFEPYYENDVYYTDASGTTPIDYNGAKFVVTILTDAEIDASAAISSADKASAKANAAILRQIFDNDGTMGGGTNKYRMYITSDEVTSLTDPLPTFRVDDYTDFEVPRYYSLSGTLRSWAPTHLADLTLYRYDATAGAYETDPAYRILSGLLSMYADSAYVDEAHPAQFDPEIHNDRWSIDFAFRSSELANDTYKLVVEKTSHITYTHTDIVLDTTVTANYDATALNFSFSNIISLFCGDIAPVFPCPDGKINSQDRDNLSLYLYGNAEWSKATSSADADWDISVYNPDSYAYAADLDGNGAITGNDWLILMSSLNWRKAEKDYGAPTGLANTMPALLSLTQEEYVVGAVQPKPDSTYQTDTDTDLVYGVTEDTKPIDGVYQVTEDTDLVYGVSEDTARIGGITAALPARNGAAVAVKPEIPALPTGEDEDTPPSEDE